MVSASTSCLELAESEQYNSVKTAARSEPPSEETLAYSTGSLSGTPHDEWTIWASFLENLFLAQYKNWLNWSAERGRNKRENTEGKKSINFNWIRAHAGHKFSKVK